MILSFFYHLGRFISLLRLMISKPENWSMYWKETVRQMNDMGVGSLIIVCLISLFIGAVSAVQIAFQLSEQIVPMYYTGYIVRDMTIIEMAPTLTCLVLAGKVGSSIAAELGGMRQKEQIDALEIMGVNTAAYLVFPKIFAALFIVPLLVAIAAFVAIIGGYLAVVPTGMITATEYVTGLRAFFVPYNINIMFVKGVVFGFTLTAIPAYQGYYVEGGSLELGQANMNAVVFSNIAILFCDFIITLMMT